MPSLYASWVLRLLLAPGDASRAPAARDWDVLLEVASANGVLVRTAERLTVAGVAVPAAFAAAVAAERERIRSTLALMQRVDAACRDRGIAFVFPKAFQDYPDFGDDVDLVVLARSTVVDRGILAGLDASSVPRDLGERIASTTTYWITGYASPLDVQHGRLGLVGEHVAFPDVLVRHARPVVVAGIEFAEPRPEDRLVLQGIQRVPGRLRIALCDVVSTVSMVRSATLDWDYVVATARQHGALPGLGCYLDYVDQVHREVLGQPLLSGAVACSVPLGGWGRIEYRDGGYRFPIIRANSRLYWRQFWARIAGADWAGAGRLCLAPLVAAARAGRRLARRNQPVAPPQGDREWRKPLAEVGVPK